MISMRTGTDGAGGSEAGRNGKRTRMMAVLLAGAFLSLMAETFLNNALPTIMKDFAVSQSTAQWLSTAYLLVVGLMIPISAWIFSSFQSRTTYMAMMAFFLLGSLVCVFSTGHFALLLTGRIIQAAAAGSLMPFIQNVVLLLFPPERRGLALGVVGLVVIWLFCRRQLSMEHPLVDLRVFSLGVFTLTTLLSTLSNISMVGIELVLPLYLQNSRGSSALTSGLVMLPGAIVMGIFNPLSGELYERIGVRRISLLGYAVLAIGTLPMAWFSTNTGLIEIAACYAVRMAGISLVMMTTFTEGINALPPRLTADGNAVASTVRQIGGSLGTAAAMMIVTLASARPADGAGRAVALGQGYHWAFVCMIAVALIGLCSSFALRRRGSIA